MLSIIKQALSQKGRSARQSGYAAEDAAAQWLSKQGLQIVARNVKYPFGELDIVAWEGRGEHAVLVLFEVRLRSHSRFGDALSSITARKQARMWAAAQAYCAQFQPTPRMRVDVLAYNGTASPDTPPQWVKNALG